MFNTLTELFLHTYFLFDNIAGKLIIDRKTLFDKLFSVFLLPKEERESLFALTQCNMLNEIKAYNDYAQFCRIQKYSEISEIESNLSSDIQNLIAIKGSALRKAKQFEYEEYVVSTEATVCQFLAEKANMGFIPSLCVLGFLQSEGIFVEKNLEAGIKNFDRAARWNSIEGILFALYYSEKNRNCNLDRLYTVTHGSLCEDIYAIAVSAYGAHSAQILAEPKMLSKAFGAEILKSEIYSSQYARFIYSKVIGVKDKERVLFSGQKDFIAEIADLPLKLAFDKVSFDDKALSTLPILRIKEIDKICRAVLNTDMCKDSVYRPICICADSDFILKEYLFAISKAFVSSHIEKIDVSDLSEYDLEPTKNNVFVRSCNEDKQNVYALYFKGEIKDYVMNTVKNILQSDKRRKFHLQHPSAVIDLSAILPICFCDKKNVALLKKYCDIITLAPVSANEKPDVLAYILQKKVEHYKMKSIQIDNAAQKFFSECSVDRAESFIDKVVRLYRGEQTLTITMEMLNEISGGELRAKTGYGFGGADYADKR